jgi:photosystem II stability/assembly factor-like uncharacterized protein
MSGLSRGRALLGIGLVTVVAALASLQGAAVASVQSSKSGWAWGDPVPQGRTLEKIAFSGGVGYAIGAGGTALTTDPTGRSWTGLTTGTSASLERLQVVNPTTLVVGGGGGCVTRISEDSGQIFRRIFNVAESGCAEPVAAFSFISAKTGWLLLGNGSVELTTDGGETFTRRTAIPGTPSSSGGGSLAGAEIHFLNGTEGIAFVQDASGASHEFSTPDGGVSWTPVALPAGTHVEEVHFVDALNAYAVGPETMLRSADAGKTWTAQAIAHGNAFNGIDCSTPTSCLLTVAGGNELVETVDGGATDVVKTTSSSLIFGAAYASPSQIVAVGQGGATVLSGDAGATFTTGSSDIAGRFARLRSGPGGEILAPGADGDLALSSDGGQTWRVLATQTSKELIDASFGTSVLGYALDASGGLQRTTNGGASWQTLNPGTSRPASAVVALGASTALVIGPGGIDRARSGGAFEPAHLPPHTNGLDDYDLAGSTLFVFGTGTHSLIRSTDAGAHWRAMVLPLAHPASRTGGKKGKKVKASPGVAVRSVSFLNASQGMLLDSKGRLWRTSNGGRSWREVLSAGTSDGRQVALGAAGDAFMSLTRFGTDAQDAYVLRTSDAGATWHPQLITLGSLPYDALVAAGSLGGAALVEGAGSAPSGAPSPARLEAFTTSSGGDVAGTVASIALRAPRSHLTRHALHAAHGAVRITGTLSGAIGGETIVVSRRNLAGGEWQHQTVVAGANGGSFTTTWHIGASSVFVAQWAGDSGRPGVGSRSLTVNVR